MNYTQTDANVDRCRGILPVFLSSSLFVRASYKATSVARGAPLCSPRRELSISQKRWTGTGLKSLKKPVSNFNAPNSAPSPPLPYLPFQAYNGTETKNECPRPLRFGNVSNFHHLTGGEGDGGPPFCPTHIAHTGFQTDTLCPFSSESCRVQSRGENEALEHGSHWIL